MRLRDNSATASDLPALLKVRLLPVLALLLLVAPRLGAADCGADLRAAVGGYVRVDSNVEPRICREVLAAVRRLPVAHRSRLHMLTVVRLPCLPGLGRTSLAGRLQEASTLCGYVPATHALVVTDQGARLRARWSGGYATRVELGQLLTWLGPKLGMDSDATPEQQWAALARRAGVPVAASGLRLGHPSVLEALVTSGARRLTGGAEEGLPEALDRALAHLILVRPGVVAGDPGRALRSWARLSGWRDPGSPGTSRPRYDDALPARAFVLALLGLEPEGRRYEPGEGVAFASPMASLCPLLDFCESYRLSGANPAAVPPAKLAAVNALGWVGTANLAEPGPLRQAEPLDRLQEGLRQTLAPSVAEHALPAPDAMAVLRAHQTLLGPMAPALPEHQLAAQPADLPPSLVAQVSVAAWEVTAGERAVRVAPARVRAYLIEEALWWRQEHPSPTLPAADAACRAAVAGRSDARKLADTARAEVAKLGPALRSDALRRLAMAYGELGLVDLALEVVRGMGSGVFGAYDQVAALTAIARARLLEGEFGPVDRLLAKASLGLRAVKQARWRDALLYDLARVYAQAGRYDAALALAARLAERSGRAPLRAVLLSEIGQLLVGEGRTERAIALLDGLVDGAIGSPWLLGEPRFARQLGGLMALGGRARQALELAAWLPAAAGAAVRAGVSRSGQAPGEILDTLRPGTERALFLVALAAAADDRGAAREAVKLYDQGLREARRIQAPSSAAAVAELVATSHLRAGRLERALDVGAPIPAVYRQQPDVAALVALARARGGDFDDAMALARTLRGHDERARILAAIQSIRDGQFSPRR